MTDAHSGPPLENKIAGPVDLNAELSKLRGFQRDTAAYAFRRMFCDDDLTTRFLVADEVGLGKTYVAKGVVALVLNHLHDTGDERHDIVYICSNAAIARQNIRKLLPNALAAATPVDRLSMLLHPDHQPQTGNGASKVNLVALTPATSFNMGQRAGKFEERVLAYALLSDRSVWGPDPFSHKRARRVFWEGVRRDGDGRLLRDARPIANKLEQADRRSGIRRAVRQFAEQLKETNGRRKANDKPSLKVAFNQLLKKMPSRSNLRLSPEAWDLRMEFIRDVRHAMARTGIDLLNPDLIVLDEFQRFKNLLNPDEEHRTEVSEHADTFFNYCDEKGKPVRCLLLSATPYKAYSAAEDADDHYEDFIKTCRFLFDDDARTSAVEDTLRQLRSALRGIGTAVSTGGAADAPLERARDLCVKLSRHLKPVMARTERLAATKDRAGMLAEQAVTAALRPDDVRAYLQLAELAERVNHHEPVEYWKSSPYPLNFMTNADYMLKRKVSQKASGGDLDGFDPKGPGLLKWSDINRYDTVDPRNPRLRWLIEDLEQRGAFEVLWIPASLRYYRADTPYETTAGAVGGDYADPGLTKRLIFSGWRVVPKAVSSLVSYEAERRSVHALQRREARKGGSDPAPYTARQDRRGGGHLALRLTRVERGPNVPPDEGPRLSVRPGSMTSLLFMWPSPALAALGNPRTDGGTDSDRPLAAVHSEVAGRIANALGPLLWQREQAALGQMSPLGSRRSRSRRRGDQRWYWAAPVLLDWLMSPREFGLWFWSCSHDFAGQRSVGQAHEGNALTKHAAWAWDLVVNEMKVHRWGRLAERDLANPTTLTEITLYGDGVATDRLEARLTPPSAVDHPPLGEMPSDLLEVLTDVAIGSPGVCSLRALATVLSRAIDDPATLGAAAYVANSFRHFFNTPEASALVELAATTRSSRALIGAVPYWRQAITHCVGGNLQAVLDEHAHVVRDWRGHTVPQSPAPAAGGYFSGSELNWAGHTAAGQDFGWGGELCRTCARRTDRSEAVANDNGSGERCPNVAVCETAATLGEALGLHTASVDVDMPVKRRSGEVDFSGSADAPKSSKRRSARKMRHRMAAAYGTQRSDQGEQRAEHVSVAFNSPFWPFVLTSTSVGQEGLDFHLWCHAVVHWNLPSNPVDLEQREGRVHRYKNHAVRRNLAAALGAQALREAKPTDDVWNKLFELGRDEDNEMVPCWVYPGDLPGKESGNLPAFANIERLVPLLPFSREVSQLAELRKKLGAYRLAIGQPRQEELLEHLSGSGALDREDLRGELETIRINLTPPSRDKEMS
ncbi:MAG: helicase-related protein [Acidimicrobiaceae bacterium]|nr:helicase-related protein [Acidimicrobiaceae bacterium]